MPAQSGVTYGASVVDMNEDGRLDVVVSLWAGTTSAVGILIGDGAGRLAPVEVTPIPTVTGVPADLVTADFSGDGHVDVVLATRSLGSSTLTALLGDGVGGVAIVGSFTVANVVGVDDLAAGDADGDGRPDVLYCSGAGDVTLLAISSVGGLSERATFVMPGTALAARLVDISGDGVEDLLVGTAAPDALLVHLGSGGGAFGPATAYPISDPVEDMIAADLDGDQLVDLLAITPDAGGVHRLLGTGGGLLGPATFLDTMSAPHHAVLLDFDGDSIMDLLTASHDELPYSPLPTVVRRGLGDGGFQPPEALFLAAAQRDLCAADTNGDLLDDLIVTEDASVLTILNSEDGLIVPASRTALSSTPMIGTLADVNADGLDDANERERERGASHGIPLQCRMVFPFNLE